MPPSQLSPEERLLRKRRAARLRQQRCRARKRQAMIEGPPKVVGSKPSAAAEFVNARTSPSQKENQAPSQRDPHPSPRTVYWVEPSQRSLYSFQPCDTDPDRGYSMLLPWRGVTTLQRSKGTMCIIAINPIRHFFPLNN